MTEPSPARPDRWPRPSGGRGTGDLDERFAALIERPVSEHVAVFEAEHDRLQRELGTIDQL